MSIPPSALVTPSSAGAAPWNHYGLKHRATSWLSRHVFDRIVYTSRHGLLKGMKRRGGLGWLPESMCGSLLTPEIRFWLDAPLAGRVVYDIGAFQGMLTLFFASRGRGVVAYEPVARNRARLTENVSLNRLANVTIRGVALADAPGRGTMRVDDLMSGGSKLITVEGPNTAFEQTEITTLDRDIAEHGLPRPGFIKIDVEGFELQVLQGAPQTLRQDRPELFLEMHGESMADKIRKTRDIVEYLFDCGYRNIRHIESASAITPQNSDQAARGHLYCRPA